VSAFAFSVPLSGTHSGSIIPQLGHCSAFLFADVRFKIGATALVASEGEKKTANTTDQRCHGRIAYTEEVWTA
jgi:hypothetical protein